jgi:hypothetical protein
MTSKWSDFWSTDICDSKGGWKHGKKSLNQRSRMDGIQRGLTFQKLFWKQVISKIVIKINGYSLDSRTYLIALDLQ